MGTNVNRQWTKVSSANAKSIPVFVVEDDSPTQVKGMQRMNVPLALNPAASKIPVHEACKRKTNKVIFNRFFRTNEVY